MPTGMSTMQRVVDTTGLSQDEGIGVMRSVLDRVCQVLTATTRVDVTSSAGTPWLEPAGAVSFNGMPVGFVGRLTTTIQKQWDLPSTMHVAQLQLTGLFAAFPPEVVSKALPTQPAIERDVSAILSEDVSWEQVHSAITSLDLPWLESIEFVTVYRGKGKINC